MKIRNGLISLFVVSLFSILFLMSHSSVYANEIDFTLVAGQVKGENGRPLSNANITAVCEGITKSTKTNGGGLYEVIYQSTCDTGSMVTVTAEKDGIGGSASGTVRDFMNFHKVDIDIAIISFSVPEFGLIPGTVAAFTSAGSFYILKKRKK